jgi:hypothetical protein
MLKSTILPIKVKPSSSQSSVVPEEVAAAEAAVKTPSLRR